MPGQSTHSFAWENLFVTLSNLYSLRAIYAGFKQKKYLAVTVLSCTTLASIIYHLSETKHGINSAWLKDYSALTLNIDRFFALCSTGLLLRQYKNKMKTKNVIFYGSLGLLAMMLSECQHVISLPLPLEKNLYLITHPIWHICAFHVAYLLIK